MRTQKNQLKKLYKLAKEAEVGSMVECPSCGTMFKKTRKQSAFCTSRNGTICKDFYWNNVTETKRCNLSRISPANAAFIERNQLYRDNDFFDDDQGWDAHKGTF